MTYKVTAKVWEHGWILHIAGVGVTQSEGVEDAEAMVRDYLELDGLDGTASIDITFEFRGSDNLDASRIRDRQQSRRDDLRELLDEYIRERGGFTEKEMSEARAALYERSTLLT
jgi:hypothetical protein